MSRKTVQIFVENILRNDNFFGNQQSEKACHTETDKRIEDYDMSICLDNYNVYPGDGRDLIKRERFLVFTPESHLFTEPDPNNWYWKAKYYWTEEGLDCCSNYSITFHYIYSRHQYTMYFLHYRLRLYGIERRFPLNPKHKSLKEISKQLNRERFDETLRGF